MRFDPTAESISEYLQRYLATHQRCRVKGVKLKLELEELAETLPEQTLTTWATKFVGASGIST